MKNEEQISKLKRIIIAVGVVVLVLLAYGFGASQKSSNTKEKKTKVETVKKKEEEELTQSTVQEFLIAFYTKKDLEENRNRYKPLMTQNMYNQAINQENEPVSQTYKGFVVNYKFKNAEIYIDQENLTALAKVSYTNTLLAEKNNFEKAQRNVPNEATLKLTFRKEKGKLLVDKMDMVIMVLNTQGENDYPNFGTPSEPQTKESEEQDGEETN